MQSPENFLVGQLDLIPNLWNVMCIAIDYFCPINLPLITQCGHPVTPAAKGSTMRGDCYGDMPENISYVVNPNPCSLFFTIKSTDQNVRGLKLTEVVPLRVLHVKF